MFPCRQPGVSLEPKQYAQGWSEKDHPRRGFLFHGWGTRYPAQSLVAHEQLAMADDELSG